MEDKLSYSLVGAFVLVLGAALVAGVLWLAAGPAGQRRYEPYQALIKESVSGLDIDAPVKYLGVDVGKVREIRLDPQNPQQVRLLLLIERGTPIKQDTLAVLRTQGLTGIAYVELSGGGVDTPALGPADGDTIPTIRSKPSLGARLENVAMTTLASLDRTSDRVSAALDAANRAEFKQILADSAALAHALAAQRTALAAAIEHTARAAANAAQASEQLAPVMARIAGGADAVTQMAGEAARASASAARAVEAADGGVRQFSGETLPEFDRLLAELNALALSLRRLSEQTERDPGSVLFGRRGSSPGPGEAGPP